MRTSVPSVSPFASITARIRSAAKLKSNQPDDPADEEDDETAEEEDDTEEGDGDGKKKKSKKVKKREDDTDEEDEDEPEARAARGRERARIQTILSSKAAKLSPGAAFHIAVHTSMPRHAAVKMLTSMVADMPKSGGGTLRDRMASVSIPDIGTGGDEAPDANDPKAVAARIIRAGARARGELKE
jgi:hypothetical protein